MKSKKELQAELDAEVKAARIAIKKQTRRKVRGNRKGAPIPVCLVDKIGVALHNGLPVIPSKSNLAL